ncbi:hypothetical protein H4R99_006857 [Coemansia sp. RSA 1722]|nr:hypothetical protein IWW45_008545 [Coemansia sp. RSA 485]KAJ2591159.1 hypothetical protein H4R99_006857 [Coemansia sp. RSA 1722]
MSSESCRCLLSGPSSSRASQKTEDKPFLSDSDIVENELNWLLAQSIPESIGHIHKQLLQLSLLNTKWASGTTNKDESEKRLAYVELNEDKPSESSGTATVSGTVITQLSLTIANFSHLNQGKPTQFYLKKNEPISLIQAQDAHNYARLALLKTQRPPVFESCDEAMYFTEALLKDICSVISALSAEREQDLMPLQCEDTEKFVPALPENLAVECSLEGEHLVVRVYWLSFRRGAKTAGILDAFKRDHSAGHMLVHNGRLAEIKREISLKAHVSEASRSLESLKFAASICTDIIEQLHAFDGN